MGAGNPWRDDGKPWDPNTPPPPPAPPKEPGK